MNYSLYHHNSKPLKYLINIYNTKIEKEKNNFRKVFKI